MLPLHRASFQWGPCFSALWPGINESTDLNIINLANKIKGLYISLNSQWIFTLSINFNYINSVVTILYAPQQVNITANHTQFQSQICKYNHTHTSKHRHTNSRRHKHTYTYTHKPAYRFVVYLYSYILARCLVVATASCKKIISNTRWSLNCGSNLNFNNKKCHWWKNCTSQNKKLLK